MTADYFAEVYAMMLDYSARQQVEAFSLNFYYCARFAIKPHAQQAIDFLREQGATFLKPHDGKFVVNPAPEAAINEQGEILTMMFQHEKLVEDVGTYGAIRSQWLPAGSAPMATFGFGPQSQWFGFSQDACFPDQGRVDPLALGLLYFGSVMYPHLKPRYGYLDESGMNSPDERSIAQNKLRYVFWANFFGPEYVEALGGRGFFEGIPGWRVVDMEDGGVLYVATESYREWRWQDHPEILRHFRKRFPFVKLYRPKPIM